MPKSVIRKCLCDVLSTWAMECPNSVRVTTHPSHDLCCTYCVSCFAFSARNKDIRSSIFRRMQRLKSLQRSAWNPPFEVFGPLILTFGGKLEFGNWRGSAEIMNRGSALFVENTEVWRNKDLEGPHSGQEITFFRHHNKKYGHIIRSSFLATCFVSLRHHHQVFDFFFHIHLYSSAGILTLANVYILQYWLF